MELQWKKKSNQPKIVWKRNTSRGLRVVRSGVKVEEKVTVWLNWNQPIKETRLSGAKSTNFLVSWNLLITSNTSRFQTFHFSFMQIYLDLIEPLNNVEKGSYLEKILLSNVHKIPKFTLLRHFFAAHTNFHILQGLYTEEEENGLMDLNYDWPDMILNSESLPQCRIWSLLLPSSFSIHLFYCLRHSLCLKASMRGQWCPVLPLAWWPGWMGTS